MTKFKIQNINRHRLLTDGNGVTTLVALFCCPLKCKYCINKNILSNNKFYELTPQELIDKIMIDYCYFVATNGGITLGGGEPLLQAKAIIELIDILPEHVSLNIETSLNAKLDEEDFTYIATKSDSLIIDTKALDSKLYQDYTEITDTYKNKHLKAICNLGLQDKCRIRIPIIPNFKDKETAEKEADYYRNIGFNNIDVFNYVIRDYM